MTRNVRHFVLDLFLLVLTLVVFLSGEHGTHSHETFWHQVLGLFIAGGVLLHLAWQWRWIVNATQRLFGKLNWRARVDYLMGCFLLLTFFATWASGLLISSWWTEHPQDWLVHLHHVSPKLFLLGVIVHTALHWRWLKARLVGSRR